MPHVSPAAFYIQEGRQDAWLTTQEAETMIAAARQSKKLISHHADHGLNDAAYRNRVGWLAQALGSG